MEQCVTKEEIGFENYLKEKSSIRKQHFRLRSKTDKVFSEKFNKIALRSNADKKIKYFVDVLIHVVEGIGKTGEKE